MLFGIHVRRPNIKTSECLGVNLKTVQRIQKELDESNGDYKSMVAQKPHSDKKKS